MKPALQATRMVNEVFMYFKVLVSDILSLASWLYLAACHLERLINYLFPL
jgi:hypothetical protein